ncbi:MAG: DUF58 domain-containing protein [Phycisphaerales bacterium]|nr:DUF58 domain-containing protein [Phycisphaerales bacterium]
MNAHTTTRSRADAISRLGPPDTLSRERLELVLRRLADDLAGGSDASTRIGAGLEYAESRPYQPGDPIRRLDWRLTARKRTPFSKQYESLRRTNTYLVVDASASMRVRSSGLSKFDAAVWLAGALGLVCQGRMCPTAVLGTGLHGARIHPSLRRQDLLLACDRLMSSPPEGGVSSVVERCELAVDSTSLFVVISDLHEPEAVVAMARLAPRHEVLALHLIDPAEHGLPRQAYVEASEAETGRAFLAARGRSWSNAIRVREQLLSHQIDTATLHLDQPIVPVVRQFFSSRGWRRGRGA